MTCLGRGIGNALVNTSAAISAIFRIKVIRDGARSFNSMDTLFRKIDIDKYDEDVLQDSETNRSLKFSSKVCALETKILLVFVKTERTIFFRNDISGALTTILEHAPYGPSVDEVKVMYTLRFIHLYILIFSYSKVYHSPNPPHDLKHHQINRNLTGRSDQESLIRYARYAHEISLQGNGYAWVGKKV